MVFNRKTRKVYRFVQDVPGLIILQRSVWGVVKGLLRFVRDTFVPWPQMLLVEYDWNCLDAEYYTLTGPSGSVIRTDHHLELFVREAPGSDTVIGSFALAPSIMVGEPIARNLWEHVRRFMEEGGPALSPGDVPAQRAPRGFWQGANALFNGPGWLIFLGLAIWLWPETWNQILYFSDHHKYVYLVLQDKTLFDAFWKPFVAIPTYMALTAVFFAVLANYLSPDVPLPAEALEGAGEELDMKKLAKEAKKPISISPNQGSSQHANNK